MISKIRFRYPIQLRVIGPRADPLEVRLQKREPHHLIEVEGSPQSVEMFPLGKAGEVAGTVSELRFVVTLLAPHEFRKTDTLPPGASLLKYVIRVVTSTLRCLRFFGRCTHLHEPEPSQYIEPWIDEYLRLYDVQWMTEDETWSSACPPPAADTGLVSTLAFASYRLEGRKATIHRRNLIAVKEAFEYGDDANAEDDFILSSIEALDYRQCRWALISAIIALEVVVSEYLRSSPAILASVTTRGVEQLKSPEMGITSRVSLLLPLLDENVGRLMDLELVEQAIRCRNKVIHEGKPLQASEYDDLSRQLQEIYRLATYLRQMITKFSLDEQLASVLTAIQERYDCVLPPSLMPVGGHGCVALVTLPLGSDPDDATLCELAEELGRELASHDERFQPREHLEVRFCEPTGTSVAAWRAGALSRAYDDGAATGSERANSSEAACNEYEESDCLASEGDPSHPDDYQ